MIQFPKHACGLYLEHNANRDMYETVAQYLSDGSADRFDWESEDEKRRAIETNEIWTLQWYPRTPVSFYAIAAASLDSLLRFALEYDTVD